VQDRGRRPAGAELRLAPDLAALVATVAELTGRGVTFTQEIQEAPWARYVSFQDPDGNSWVIQELRGR
jgi:uncharacterized glyoxalase superfamily protein PhnB